MADIGSPSDHSDPSDLKTQDMAQKRTSLAVLAERWRARAEVSPGTLQADLRDAFEERAAILEFDAGLPRAEAERLAWVEVMGTQP
ncbi:hypothetical protein M0638_20435 [Roseomonas sp. NAR14]|uniref:Uncharacterized protein n=1 Tax=Roseomonas acroporae TaxID=2937791 RepID=A0A9X1YCS1_9PROT|nr:hypothetical protein [Roseomonas acroporae]MCK8786743.1 hypothetical protein [Roseomonas acroporae]